MSKAALFVKARTGNNTNVYQQKDGQINCGIFIHRMRKAVEMNELQLHHPR